MTNDEAIQIEIVKLRAAANAQRAVGNYIGAQIADGAATLLSRTLSAQPEQEVSE